MCKMAICHFTVRFCVCFEFLSKGSQLRWVAFLHGKRFIISVFIKVPVASNERYNPSPSLHLKTEFYIKKGSKIVK
jgi:hypothetical protein